MEAAVRVVWGKTGLLVPVSQVRATASNFKQVLVDVGTGDGRWVYRTARAHPEWFCVGMDAHAAGMREVSFRASRKPSRGGTPNVWFLCTAIETLPTGLERLADHITIFYPWGYLLRIVLDPDVQVMRRIASLGKPGARVEICVNASAVRAVAARRGDPTEWTALLRRLTPDYTQAGIVLTTRALVPGPPTTWQGKIGQGRAVASVFLAGTVGAAGGSEL